MLFIITETINLIFFITNATGSSRLAEPLTCVWRSKVPAMREKFLLHLRVYTMPPDDSDMEFLSRPSCLLPNPIILRKLYMHSMQRVFLPVGLMITVPMQTQTKMHPHRIHLRSPGEVLSIPHNP